jgi:WD40 repeat protein
MSLPATAGFFATGGAVPLRSPSYCTRSADEELYAGLLRGEFCYILTTRQIGKTSLTARTAERLRDDGLDVAFLDLTEIGADCNKEQWYYTLLSNVGEDLGLRHALRTLWTSDTQLTPLQHWIDGLRMVLRARPAQRLVIFIDEIDYVRVLPFDTSEFFAAIRACYNRRTLDAEFNRLTFCLIGVATPSDLIEDVRVTPFNIGCRIEPVDFSPDEAASLVLGFQCDPSTGRGLLERVLYWTGGHPYLTQRLCHEIALRPETLTAAQVNRLCADLFMSPAAQERDANLTFVRDRLLRSGADIAALLCLYDQMYRGQTVHHNRANPLIDILMLSGLVRSEQGEIVVRNRIYARVFDRAWVREHMPDAELRRQRSAYLRGAVRTAAIAGVLLTIVGGLGLVALKQAHRAREAEQNATRLLYVADMNLAQQALNVNNVARAQDLLEAQRPAPGQDEDPRGFEWRYFWRLCHGDLFTFHGHTNRVRSIAYSPDGKLLASGGDDNTIHLWNIAARSGVTLGRHQDWVFAVAFSPDGTILASGSQDHTVRLWEVNTGRMLKTLVGHSAPVNSIAFSPDGKLLASAGDDHTIRLWDINTCRLVSTLAGHKFAMSSLAFSPDGKMLACGNASNRDRMIQLWNIATRRSIKTFTLQAFVFPLAFSHNGKLLAAGEDSGAIEFWDTATWRHWTIPTAHRFTVNSVAFSPDDKTLASGSWDGTIKLWDVTTHSEQVTLRGHADLVNTVAFSPDGKTLASGSNDRTVRLWDISPEHMAAYREMLLLNGHHETVNTLAFSHDGRTLGSGSFAGSTSLWDTITLRPTTMRPTNPGFAISAFSPDGGMVALIYRDNTIGLWDVAANRNLCTYTGHGKSVIVAVFSPDGKLLASGSQDNTVRLWDTVSRRSIHTFAEHTGDVDAVAFSPNGKLLASGSGDNTVRLWDIATQRLIATLGGHLNGVWSVAFSSDSKMLASGTWDQSVILWDVATRKRIATLRGHTNSVVCIAFSPDRKTLVSGSNDNTLKLWNIATQQEMATIRFRSPVHTAAFSPDGDTLAVGLDSGAIYLLRAAIPKEVRDYEAR